MSSHTRNALVNKDFEGTIGEPWDFRSEAGQNKIKGIITFISEENSTTEWLLLDIAPFEYQGAKITQLLGVNRYKKRQEIFSNLLNGKSVILNFLFMISGEKFNKESVLLALAHITEFRFLVGSINSIKSS